MKALFPSCIVALIALGAVAYTPTEEKVPENAAAKIREAVPKEPYVEPQTPRKLLVFSRTNGFRHDSIPTGKLALTVLGDETGAFETKVTEDMAEFEVENLARYDAVCFLSTTQNVFSPFKEVSEKMSPTEKKAAKEYELQLKDNLMSFVRNGGGFVGIHAATDTFYEWAEYGQMINGYFDGHPWNADMHVSIKVEPGKEAHPLVAMFNGENVEFKEEIYQHRDPYDSSEVDMLLRLDTEKTNMEVKNINRDDGDFGVSWAREWGKGRVFYCSIGHNHDMYWHPKILRHYLAGIQWSLGDYRVPN